MKKKRIVIMGAAGRDFHNFNTVYRDNDGYEVVAITATQIPNIAGRKYPAAPITAMIAAIAKKRRNRLE